MESSLYIIVIRLSFCEPCRVLADTHSDDVALLEDSAMTLEVLLETVEEKGLVGAVDGVWRCNTSDRDGVGGGERGR
jgi:hypothetical protein